MNTTRTTPGAISAELLPCPFCGGTKIKLRAQSPYWIAECACGVATGLSHTKDQAHQDWNTRTPATQDARAHANAASEQPADTGVGAVAWLLTDEKINDLQVSTVQTLVRRAKHAHYCNVYLRINGKDELYQADWLKHLVAAPPAIPHADQDKARNARSVGTGAVTDAAMLDWLEEHEADLVSHRETFGCDEGEFTIWWNVAKENQSISGHPLGSAREAIVAAIAAHHAAEGTPSSRWAEKGEPDPHGKRYNCERAALALGDMTDDELANAVFMHGDRCPTAAQVAAGVLMPGVYLTAAKDRIRWLSRKLAAAEGASSGETGDARE